MIFISNGITFENKSNCYYKSIGKFDKKGNPIMMRVKPEIVIDAYESGNIEIIEHSENETFKSKEVSLTGKQQKLLELAGEELGEWTLIKSLCETISEEFNSMAVGAIISTLQKKGVLEVEKREDGKYIKLTNEYLCNLRN